MASTSRKCTIRYPSRVEGWLNVWEVESSADVLLFKDGKQPQPGFTPWYCILLQDEKILGKFSSETLAKERRSATSSVRIDGGKALFDKRWGYGELPSIKESPINNSYKTVADRIIKSNTWDTRIRPKYKDSSYEKAVNSKDSRRGSVPIVAPPMTIAPDLDNMSDTGSGSFKFSSIFSKKGFKSNLKRTKSATKLDRKKNSTTFSTATEAETNIINSRLRTSRSHESLLTTANTSMSNVDLSAPDIEIKPLHSSILGQDHCFQVSTSNGSKYYSCRTAEEREKWIECLRKTVHPNQEQSRRTDISLKLWILEAKNVQTKKRYFCEICLDKTLYARTSSKGKTDMLFWGENFDFNNLPPVETVTVNIYREADKKKKRDRNQCLGYVNIPVYDIDGRQLVERWYTSSSGVVGKKDSKGELPLIRIRAKYQTVHILPMEMYQGFIKYVSMDYHCLVDVMEPVISVKAKEDLATSLVHILQRMGKAKSFLSDIIMGEIDRLDNEHLTFRGNSIATKAMEAYMKLVGEKYLQDTLGDLVRAVLDSSDDCEVDPMKVVNNSTLQRQQTNLIMYCEMAWCKIINSARNFPSELRDVFASCRELCQERKKEDLSGNLISASIFLRFLCPAIMSPSLFGLTQEFPGEKASRNLILIAKTLQSLANFTKFGGKEEYMTFMNDFVEREWGNMKDFLKRISTMEEHVSEFEFDGYIDLGKELSILHSLLSESLQKLNETTETKLGRLKTHLSHISDCLKNPQTSRKYSMNKIQIYDNLMSMVRSSSTVNHGPNLNNNINHDSVAVQKTMPHSIKTNKTHENLVKTNSNELHSQRLSPVTNKTDAANRTRNGNVTAPNADGANMNRNWNRGRNRQPIQDLSPGGDYVVFSSLDDSNTSVSSVQSRSSVNQVNKSWNDLLKAATVVNGGEYVDLLTYMDDNNEEGTDIMERGSEISAVTSGYHSVLGQYSQSSSPVESVLSRDTTKSPPILKQQTALSFSNPAYRHNEGMLQKSLSTPETTRRKSSTSSLNSIDGVVLSKPNKSPRVAHTKSEELILKPNNLPVRKAAYHLSSSSSDSLVTPPTERRRYNRMVSTSNSNYVRVVPSPRTVQRQNAHDEDRSSSQSTPILGGNRPKFIDLRLTSNQLSQSSNYPQGSASANSSSNCSTPTGQLREFPMKSGQLSQSADFVYLRQGDDRRDTLKRAESDQDSSHYYSLHKVQTPPSPVMNNRCLSLPHKQVRMGIRSVQRKIDQEKTKVEYEDEINKLKQQLQEAELRLKEAEQKLSSHKVDNTSEWQQKLIESEQKLIEERKDKDKQMEDIIQRLMTVEDELKREQMETRQHVAQKQKIVDAQERRIQTLDAANTRLLTALNQLKERYHVQTKNGLVGGALKLSLADTGEYRSSTC